MNPPAEANAVSPAPAQDPAVPVPGLRKRLPARYLALGAGAGALLLLFFIWPYQHWYFTHRSSVVWGWFKVLSRPENGEWFFCFLIPPIVAFLIHLRRNQLKKLPLLGEGWGALVVCAGLFFYWVGYKVDTGYAGYIAAQLVIGGLIVLLGGREWMKALLFPWLFLAFMWPMFPLEERLAAPLRMITAEISGKFLGMIGIGVVREGSSLISAADAASGLRQGELFRLDVDAACSGIKSLFSLAAISALYGYLSLRKNFPRLVLFAASIPLAMLGNFSRMVLLALGSIWFGSEVAVGRNINGHQEMSFYHTLAGYAVFAVALAGMFAISSLLERGHWNRLKKLARNGAGAATQPDEADSAGARSRTMVNAAVAVALALAGIGICAATNVSPTMAEPGVTLRLPLQVGDYQGTPFEMTAVERNILDEGVKLERNIYLSARGMNIVGTIILSGMGKRNLHRPEVCLPGAGWTISDRTHIPIQLADGREITAMLLRIFRDHMNENGQMVRNRACNIYWYVGSDGKTCPDYYDHIRLGYTDAVLHNLNHRWAMASFFIPLPESIPGMEDPILEARATEEMRTFISKVAPEFMTVGVAKNGADSGLIPAISQQ